MLLLPLPNGRTVLLQPVPFFYVEAYQILRLSLPSTIGDIAIDRDAWGRLQKLVLLHPRADVRGEWGFTLPADYSYLDGLLPKLDELNAVEAIAQPEPKQGKAVEIPIKSSGDSVADLVADLAAIYGVRDALTLLQTFSPDKINKIIYRANERQRPEEDRRDEALSNALEHWNKQQNPFENL
jgi:hypothetical protein